MAEVVVAVAVAGEERDTVGVENVEGVRDLAEGSFRVECVGEGGEDAESGGVRVPQ